MDPAQQLQAFLQAGQTRADPFPQSSRYYGLGTKTCTSPDGRTEIYLPRRFLPSADAFALLQYHTVADGDRLDNVTARFLNDPQQFWRICDANAAMRPDELTETIGRQLRITLPQGIPALPSA